MEGRSGCLGPNIQELSLQMIQIKAIIQILIINLKRQSLRLLFWGNFKILHFDTS